MNKYKLYLYLFWLFLYVFVLWGALPVMILYKEGVGYLFSVVVTHIFSLIIYKVSQFILFIIDICIYLSDKAKQGNGGS